MLPRLVEAAAHSHAPLRRGLPRGFLSHAGSAAAHRPPTAERRAFEQRVAESLRRVLQLTTERADLTAALAHEAADTIGADFMRNRLPPFGGEGGGACGRGDEGEGGGARGDDAGAAGGEKQVGAPPSLMASSEVLDALEVSCLP